MSTPGSKILRIALVVVCILGVVLVVMRCSPGVRAPAGTGSVAIQNGARLQLSNPGGAGWEVCLTSEDGGTSVTKRLAAGGEVEVRLPAGRYEVEQRLAEPVRGAPQTRRFTLVLFEGKVYHWKMVSLLSAGAQELDGHPSEAVQP